LNRMAEESEEQNRATMRAAPRSYWLVLAAVCGLIVILIVVLHVSPLHMIWWIFISSWLVAGMLTERLFQRAKSGALPSSPSQ